MFNKLKRGFSLILPYRPMDGRKEVLETEYRTGTWDYLAELEELSRFSVVAGYCHFLKNKGSILEIGCGEGILQERLDKDKYSRYVGIDISPHAVRRAAGKHDYKTSFIEDDARSYVPAEAFDVIIFNECLEYFDGPLDLVRRYERFLKPDGLYIVSMFVGLDTARTSRIWKMLESVCAPRSETRVINTVGYTWIIKVFAPLRAEQST